MALIGTVRKDVLQRDTISQRNRLEKMRLETEQQNATKSGNEFVAICRFNLPLFAACCR